MKRTPSQEVSEAKGVPCNTASIELRMKELEGVTKFKRLMAQVLPWRANEEEKNKKNTSPNNIPCME
jgi:hypothetical protein